MNTIEFLMSHIDLHSRSNYNKFLLSLLNLSILFIKTFPRKLTLFVGKFCCVKATCVCKLAK